MSIDEVTRAANNERFSINDRSPMNETSHSLIEQLCNDADAASWERLVRLYSPLLRGWIERYDVQAADADDLIQEVLAVVLKELPTFDHNRQTGAFRSWLRRILVNRIRNLWRSRKYEPQGKGTTSLLEQLHQLEDDRSELSRIWDAEHDQHIISQLLEAVRPRFEGKTWEAFRRQMFDGQRADDVANELDMSLSSVYVARSRILSRLRLEADGLVDAYG